MRTSIFLLSLAATSILLSACNPRDNKLTKPDTRVGSSGLPVDGKTENYKFVAVLVERQIEVIELYKAITDADFATSRKIDLSTSGKISISNSSDQTKAVRKLSLNSEIFKDQNGTIQKIILTEDETNSSFESAVSAGKDVQLKNITKKIIIQKSTDGTLDASFKTVDELNSKATGKATSVSSVKFKFSATDATQDIFKIHATEVSHTRMGLQIDAQTALKSVQGVDLDLTVEMKNSDSCSLITGVVKLEAIEMKKGKEGQPSVPLYTNELTYTKSSLNILAGKAFDFNPPLCEVVTPVDLSKLL